jgi:hypothetical protein
MNNYHNTSSVNTTIDTLGWPTLAERRLKTRLIMCYKITHCLIGIPTDIFVPSDNRLRKHHSKAAITFFSDKDSSTRFGAISKAMKIVNKTDDQKLPVIFYRHLICQYLNFL